MMSSWRTIFERRNTQRMYSYQRQTVKLTLCVFIFSINFRIWSAFISWLTEREQTNFGFFDSKLLETCVKEKLLNITVTANELRTRALPGIMLIPEPPGSC